MQACPDAAADDVPAATYGLLQVVYWGRYTIAAGGWVKIWNVATGASTDAQSWPPGAQLASNNFELGSMFAKDVPDHSGQGSCLTWCGLNPKSSLCSSGQCKGVGLVLYSYCKRN